MLNWTNGSQTTTVAPNAIGLFSAAGSATITAGQTTHNGAASSAQMQAGAAESFLQIGNSSGQFIRLDSDATPSNASFLLGVEGPAPSNPASGNDLLYFDSTSHNLTCLRSTGASCLPGGGGGGISTITSTGGTVTVTNPSGPTTNLEVAASGTPVQTCDASTIANYQPAICVVTMNATTLNAFDGTTGTAVQVVSAPANGEAIVASPSAGIAEVLPGSQPFGGRGNVLVGYGAAADDHFVFIASPVFESSVPTFTSSNSGAVQDVTVSDASGADLFLYLQTALGGPVATASVTSGNAGTGYAPGDTGTIQTFGNDAAYLVGTVDGGGGVLTFSITNGGTGYVVSTGNATGVGGSQPGSGAGLEIDINSVTLGNGAAIFTIPFTVIPVGVGAITASTLDSGGNVTAHPIATVTAGHAGTGYVTGDLVLLACTAGWSVTASGGAVTGLSFVAPGNSCTTGAGQSTTAGTGVGTGLELDVSSVDAGWNVSDTFTVSSGNDDATGHVTAVNGSHQITTYVIDSGGTGYSVSTNPDIFQNPLNIAASINITAVF